MTTLLLVRHAAHDWLGRGIPGRMPGVSLNAQGRLQAEQLPQRLAGTNIDAVYSSPQQRARETAAPLAIRRQVPVQVAPEFDEIDFGDWTGLWFGQLRADAKAWQAWVERRSSAAAPGGEAFVQVQRRALAGMTRLHDRHPVQTVAVISHGDVIKAVLGSVLRMSMDDLERLDIEPASISIVEVHAGEGRVLLINDSGARPGSLTR